MHAEPEGSMSSRIPARLVLVLTFSADAPTSVLACQCRFKEADSDLATSM